ncbi:hypothetical protein BGW39_009099 [Mortierella sp. 14UC]|nr:hypothetical protein BGW39_009099 [Mortierella sp. 14UC]
MQAALDNVTQQLQMIRDLEVEEQDYITPLQTRSTDADGNYIFKGTFANQEERVRLHAVRLQIYTGYSSLLEYLAELAKHNSTLAEEHRFMVFQTMMMKRDRLWMEVRAYLKHGYGEIGMNATHVQRNNRLADDISATFDLPGRY